MATKFDAFLILEGIIVSKNKDYDADTIRAATAVLSMDTDQFLEEMAGEQLNEFKLNEQKNLGIYSQKEILKNIEEKLEDIVGSLNAIYEELLNAELKKRTDK